MSKGVIPDRVSRFDDFAHDVRTHLDVASDHEKRGVDVVFCKNFQKPQRMRIVGAIIVGKRDLL